MQPVKIITFVYIQVRLEIRGLDRNRTEPATMSGKGRPGYGPPPASGASATGMAGSNPPYPSIQHCTQQQQPHAPLLAYSPASTLRAVVSLLVWHVCSTISLAYDLIYIVLAQSGLCCVHHPLI